MKPAEYAARRLPGLLACYLAWNVLGAEPSANRAASPEPPTEPSPPAVETREAPRYVGELVNVLNNSILPAGRRAAVVVTVFGNAEVAGDVDDACVTVFGNTRLDGRVRNECVTVFGNLDLNGKVNGDLVVFMGDARLGPRAEVGGETVVIGGRLETAPGATLHGQKIHLAGFLKGLGEWFRHGFLLGRPIPPGVGWVWWIVAAHFLLYLLVAALLPRAVAAGDHTLEQQALPAFGIGLLGLILAAPLSFVLLASGVGLLVLPLLLLALQVALLVGKTSVFQWLGRSLCRQFNPAGTCPPLLGFVAGFVLITLLYMVPGVGFVVYGLLIPLAFGAALLAMVDAVRAGRAPKPAPTAPPPSPEPTTPHSPAAAAPPASVAPEAGLAAPAIAPAAVAGFAMPVVCGPAEPTASLPQAVSPAAPAPLETATPAPALAQAGAAPTPPVAPPATPPPPGAGPGVSGLGPAELASLPRAGFWLRTAAAALDVLLLAWLVAPLPGSVPGPFFVLVLIAYHAAFWAWKGTTLGGLVCGLKVVRTDGRPLDRSVALVRALAAVFSALPLFLGFFWAGWSAERRSWHDLIAGTLIVKVPRGEPLI
jgi:uncharacterized RDD family membrane protein YckC